MIFSERLKELREERNMSQRDLAKATGLSQTAIHYWESGLRVPNINALIIFAKYFGVSSDYLIGIED